jgi:hypothetical protein
MKNEMKEMFEAFHVIELAPGTYFCGSQTADGKVHWASVGTPLLAKRADPTSSTGDLTEIKKVFPQARFAYVRATWNIS